MDRLSEPFGGVCSKIEPSLFPVFLPPSDSFVYLTQCGDDGPIKVGFAEWSATQRANDLQAGCPYDLNVRFTFPGDRSLEHTIHSALRDLRMRGEWFRPAPNFLDRVTDAVRSRVPGSLYQQWDRVRRATPACRGHVRITDLNARQMCAYDESIHDFQYEPNNCWFRLQVPGFRWTNAECSVAA